jgi:arsenate reductase
VIRPLKRVLFVCIGNACRSQMAEAFARAYGQDVLIAASAGLHPAMRVAPDTMKAMQEKDMDLRDHFPKSIRQLGPKARFDVVVNMSGMPLPEGMEAAVESWYVPDPVSMKYDDHCAVRDKIEGMVMELVLELRREQGPGKLRGQGSGPVEI